MIWSAKKELTFILAIIERVMVLGILDSIHVNISLTSTRCYIFNKMILN